MTISQISQILAITVMICSHQLKAMEMTPPPKKSGGPVRGCDTPRANNPYGNPKPDQARGLQGAAFSAVELRSFIAKKNINTFQEKLQSFSENYNYAYLVISAQCVMGMTMLHHAVASQNIEFVKIVISVAEKTGKLQELMTIKTRVLSGIGKTALELAEGNIKIEQTENGKAQLGQIIDLLRKKDTRYQEDPTLNNILDSITLS